MTRFRPLAAVLAMALLFSLCGLAACAEPPAKAKPAPKPVKVDPLKIDGPEESAPGDLVILSASGGGKKYKWTCIPDNKRWLAVDEGSRVVFATGTIGVYTFVLATAAGDEPDLAQFVVRIGDGGDNPPNPPLPPGPGPQPQPGAKWQVMFWIESADLDSLTPQQRGMLGSLKLRRELEAKGHQFRGCYDVDLRGPNNNVPAALAPWRQAVDGDPLPRVAVAPIEGGTILDVPLPADEAGLWQLLQQPKGASR